MRIQSAHIAFSLRSLAPVALLLLAACSSGGGDSGGATPAATYAIGGTVTGLTGTVVLQNNGSDNLSVSVNGTFAFATKIAAGAAYNVSVLTQPTGQTCSASANAGTASADVSTVVVTCSANPARTIGGAVTGLTGAGLVLQNNSGDNLAIGANAPFTFATPVADGAGYNVSVLTQPAGQSCTVTNGLGIANANITNVAVTCSAITYGIKAAVSGLAAGKSVTLQNNGKDNYNVSSNLTISFFTRYSDGANYNVTVLTQPVGQTCTVNGGTGTVAGADVTVQVICSANSYLVGGSVTGLAALGTVQLKNSATNETFTVNAPGSTFTFPTKIAQGSNTVVTVNAQPVNQYCTVTSPVNGAINNILADVTNVAVSCVNTYVIGGMISSTITPGGGPTLQNNGGDTLAINAITTTPAAFAFATRIPDGQAYNVTQLVRASAPIQECTVTNGSGTVAGADVANVTVSCTPITAIPKFALVANSTANTVTSYTIAGGALTTASAGVATGSEPYAVAVEASGTYAYVVNRTSNSISAYSINPADGTLSVIDLDPVNPATTTVAMTNVPTSISIHPSGKFAYVVGMGNLHQMGGTTPPAIAAYSIATGALSVIDLDPLTAGTTIAAGQIPYQIVVDPSGRFAYVPNSGNSTVSAYTVNQTTGTLTSVGSIASGASPVSVAVDPLGNCALVANNGSTTVSAYSINQTTGALTAVGAPVTSGGSPRSVAIDPVAGAYAYVANAGDATVSGFTLDPATCVLTAMADVDLATVGNQASIAAGVTPFSVSIDPTAAYVYVANFGGDTVSTYSIGTGVDGGKLTAVGAATATGTGPVAVTTVAK
jgi:DNA-binding beta-propeller fold protein YncE